MHNVRLCMPWQCFLVCKQLLHMQRAKAATSASAKTLPFITGMHVTCSWSSLPRLYIAILLYQSSLMTGLVLVGHNCSLQEQVGTDLVCL